MREFLEERDPPGTMVDGDCPDGLVAGEGDHALVVTRARDGRWRAWRYASAERLQREIGQVRDGLPGNAIASEWASVPGGLNVEYAASAGKYWRGLWLYRGVHPFVVVGAEYRVSWEGA